MALAHSSDLPPVLVDNSKGDPYVPRTKRPVPHGSDLPAKAVILPLVHKISLKNQLCLYCFSFCTLSLEHILKFFALLPLLSILMAFTMTAASQEPSTLRTAPRVHLGQEWREPS